ncbi:hypothetical protein SLA2020_267880 [Shorea laevis]
MCIRPEGSNPSWQTGLGLFASRFAARLQEYTPLLRSSRSDTSPPNSSYINKFTKKETNKLDSYVSGSLDMKRSRVVRERGSRRPRAIEWQPRVGFHFGLVLRSPFKLQSMQRSGAFGNAI